MLVSGFSTRTLSPINLASRVLLRFYPRGRVLALCAGILFALSAHATTLRISPVGLELPATQRAGSITLVNTGSEPVNLQLRVFHWSQVDGGDVLEPTTDLLVTPPAATVPPGASYTVRVARPAAASVDRELSYRLVIDELPKPIDPRKLDQGVSMVLRTSLPVFFADKDAVAQLAWKLWRDSDGVHAEVTNDGERHAKLAEMTAHAPSGVALAFGQGRTGYVLAGTRRRFDLPAQAASVLAVGGQVKLSGRNGRLAIEETLHVQEAP